MKTLTLEIEEPQNELERFAHAVADDLHEREGVPGTMAFDPMTIALILSIVIELGKLYLHCNRSPAQSLKSMKKPSWLERIRLWLTIRSTIKGNDDYRHLWGLREQIGESFLRTGKTLNEEKIAAVFGEVNF